MMRFRIVCIISSFFLNTIQAQKTEISIGVNGNFSFFRGNNTSANTFFSVTDTTRAYRYSSDNDYSKVVRIGAGVEGLIQRVMKDKFIVGFAVSPELISGRIKIFDFNAGIANPKQIGQTTITHTFIQLYPFIGRRFVISPYTFDIHLGLEAGIPITAHEKTKVSSTTGNKTLLAERDRRKVFDLRPRMQFRLQRGHYGLETGFALGTITYATGFFNQAYSAIARLGIYYVL